MLIATVVYLLITASDVFNLANFGKSIDWFFFKFTTLCFKFSTFLIFSPGLPCILALKRFVKPTSQIRDIFMCSRSPVIRLESFHTHANEHIWPCFKVFKSVLHHENCIFNAEYQVQNG